MKVPLSILLRRLRATCCSPSVGDLAPPLPDQLGPGELGVDDCAEPTGGVVATAAAARGGSSQGEVEGVTDSLRPVDSRLDLGGVGPLILLEGAIRDHSDADVNFLGLVVLEVGGLPPTRVTSSVIDSRP